MGLWNVLEAAGFKSLNLRFLNQDPLENFFGQVRARGGCNSNPTCMGFISNFKTLLINSFFSEGSKEHNQGFNCEHDEADPLTDFSNMISESMYNTAVPNTSTFDYDIDSDCDAPTADNLQSIDINMTLPTDSYAEIVTLQPSETRNMYPRNYVCGWVAKKIILVARSHKCNDCWASLTTRDTLPEHSLISDKEYTVNSLKRPNSNFFKIFTSVSRTVSKLLLKNYKMSGLIKFTENYIKRTTNLTSLGCINHDLKDIFLKTTIRLILFSWLKRVTRILNGKDTRVLNNMDALQLQAAKYYFKYRKRPFNNR